MMELRATGRRNRAKYQGFVSVLNSARNADDLIDTTEFSTIGEMGFDTNYAIRKKSMRKF